MKTRWSDISRVSKNSFLVAMAFTLSLQAVSSPSNVAYAASGTKKSSIMQMPMIEKLDESGKSADEPKLGKQTAKADLSPLKLGSEKPASGSESDTSGDVLNATVSETDFVPKGPVDKGTAIAPPVSVKDLPSTLEEKVIKDARKTNIMPLALMESRDEADHKMEARYDAEKTQLTDLWNATLTRSPDIQFVTQKLLPSSAPGHTTGVMMRFLSLAMMGGVGTLSMISPGPSSYAMSSVGSNMIGQVLNITEGKNAKAQKLNQTETIMLYTIVRNTADKLVENYRNYKKSTNSLKLAELDLGALQKMVRDSRSDQSPAVQIEMEYTLRKAQRDIDEKVEESRKYRQSLIDLAGHDALAKLDKQVEDESGQVDPALAEAEKEGLGSPDSVKTNETEAATTASNDATAPDAVKVPIAHKTETAKNAPIKLAGKDSHSQLTATP